MNGAISLPGQSMLIDSIDAKQLPAKVCGAIMRVITEVFSIEHEQLVVCHSVDGALNHSTPTIVKDVIIAFREWLGMHEGENRTALLEQQVAGGSRPAHKEAKFRLLFSTVLMDQPRTQT
jgi:hypothetical protein